MKKADNNKIKIGCSMGLFKYDIIGKISPIEMFILKNILEWAKSDSMTKLNNFKYDNVGFWVSSKKAQDWGMQKYQLKYVLKQLHRPLKKSDPKSIILFPCKVNSPGRSGSRTFVVINPSILFQIIEWGALSNNRKNDYQHLIFQTICQGTPIETQASNFLKLEKIVGTNIGEISTKIKLGMNKGKKELPKEDTKIIQFNRNIV